MVLYISTKSIIQAYQELIKVEVKNASILHIFLIIKACGINNFTFESSNIIAQHGYRFASDLSSLFGYNEIQPQKNDFINPFSMQGWKQAPSETLKKWISGRVKNNIIGGAVTWRKIIRQDIDDDKIKFTHDYVQAIKDLTLTDKKINLWALVVWCARFTRFKEKPTPNEIIQTFINEFKLSEYEISLLFERTIPFHIEYSETSVDMSQIRNLIGAPSEDAESYWSNQQIISTNSNEEQEYYEYKEKLMNLTYCVSPEKITKLIKKNFQVILSGPPGTSKSYIANLVAHTLIENNGEGEYLLKVQFHPQYSYQDFIGGFIVNGDKVEPCRGIFLKFLDNAKEFPDKKFVLIIDEINRANVSSVFGELIQCLDRNYVTTILVAGQTEQICIPKNLYIIATMNTTDKTLGIMDFALKRRFIDIYMPSNESELIDKVKIENDISITDFVKKVNVNLRNTLRNNEFVIGQAIFYNDAYKQEDIYYFSIEDFEDFFNYKILSIIEDYCNRDESKIVEVVGEKLSKRLIQESFIQAINEFML